MRFQKKILSVVILCTLLAITLHAESSQEIIKNLEDTIQFTFTEVTNGAFDKISDLKIIEARMDVNLNNDGNYGGTSVTSYLVQQGDSFIKVVSHRDLFEMPLFYESIKKSFKLKTAEDGLLLQSALPLFTQEMMNEGFYQQGNTWVFIQNAFFERFIVVETDDTGKILSIKQPRKFKPEIPKTVQYKNERKSFPDYKIPEVTSAERSKLIRFLKDNLDYHFEVEGNPSVSFSQISAAKLYNAKFVLVEHLGEDSMTSSYTSFLLSYQGERVSSPKFWETDLFIKSTHPLFRLKTDQEAALFQAFLNDMEEKTDDVRFYRNDDLWIFVRDKSFGEERGYILKTDKEGRITRLAPSSLDDSDLLRFRMKEPGFKADYGFTLKEPAKTKFHYSKKELDKTVKEKNKPVFLYVSITFNEDPVNAMSAWILTRDNGQNVGMLAGTDMTSPFADSIPVSQLPKGTHNVEYLLLLPGEDTEHPLGKVAIEIVIE